MPIRALFHERLAAWRLAPSGRNRARAHCHCRPADRTRARLQLEGLEDRCLLSGGPPITEFPLPSGNQPYQIAAGLDGNLWFTIIGTGGDLGMINPTTHAIAAVPLPATNDVPNAIAAGPDGNLWFTGYNGTTGHSYLGMINPTTDGVTEFTLNSVPNGNDVARGITTGPDGNLWFTDPYANEVGMINPTTHAIAEFTVPTANAYPFIITAGPDGNLWFTESQANQIGMINPTTHTITEFATPTVGSHPYFITAGPDGNLWFTENGGGGVIGQIGMINPTTHAIAEFTSPTNTWGPFGIAAGLDGNLWFTDINSGLVGMINPTTHTITEYPIPYTGQYQPAPGGITAGPDGNLWFTDERLSGIGVVTLSTSTSVTHLVVTQQPPASVTAGSSFGLTVQVEDSSGNLDSSFNGTVTVALANNPDGATLGGTLTATASGGVATFSRLTLNTAASGYSLQVSATGLGSATTSAFTVTPAAASQVLITQQPPASVVAGSSFGLQATIEDPYGNVETGDSGAVTVALASNTTGATLGGTTSLAASQGVASFSGLVLTQAASGYTLRVASGPLSATTTAITVTPAAPAKLAWADQPTASLTAGSTFGLTVGVEDAYGNLTAFSGGLTVAAATGPAGATLGGQTSATARGGMAAFVGLSLTRVGSYTLQVSSSGLPPLTTNPITVTPASPSQLVVTTPPPGSVTAGSGFALAVSAEDQYGNLTPSFSGTVTISIGTGPTGQTLGGTTSVVANSGSAGFSGLTLDKVGSYSLQASGGSLDSTTTGTITITPAAAAQLNLLGEPPGSLTAGAEFGFRVEAEDPFGNLATGFAGTVTVALSANPGNATLGGPAAVAASSGVASFAGLSLTRVGSGYTLQVTSGSLTGATTSAFSVTPAAAAQLVLSTKPPRRVIAGSPFGLSLTVEDPYGNVATTFGGMVNLALSNSPAQGVLNGALTAAASNGLVAFSGLTLDTAAAGYTITATSGGLSAVTSGPIDVAPAAAAQLVVSIPPPATVTAGAEFGLAIAAEDPYGNLATDFTGSVMLALAKNPGQATLTGRPLTVTATGGVASFPAFLSLDRAASGYTIQAASAGLMPVTTGDITVTALPATHLVVLTQPPSLLTPGTPFGLIVAAEDPYGNVDPSFSGPVVVAPAGGSGTSLSGGTTITASQGVASFTGLTLSRSSSAVSLQVASTGLAGTMTDPLSVTAPAQLQFAAPSVTINENAGAATVQIVRAGGFSGAVSVDVATSGGTAVPGVNYTPVNQVVNFAAGQDTQTVTIPVQDDGVAAPDVTVTLRLSGPGAGAVLGSPATATLVIHNVHRPPTPPPLVTMQGVQLVTNRKHRVTGVIVDFSGGINAAQAQNTAEYRLATAGNRGSFTAGNARVIPLRSALYNTTSHTVILTPKKPFALKKPVQLVVSGSPPSGLTDDLGRPIDGRHDGQPGGNAIAVLQHSGATISRFVRGPLSVVRRGSAHTLSRG